MSVEARSVSGMTTGFTWTGAWVAAILLALIFAVSLFAMNNRTARVHDRMPADSRVQPVEFGGSVCHQCR